MEAAVSLETLLAGYRQAYKRWMSGPRIDPDPDQAFFAIFEALNWAVTVDDRLSDVLVGWPRGYDERDSLLGFRYARNAVHHDWADALWVDLSGRSCLHHFPRRCGSGAGVRRSIPRTTEGLRSTALTFRGSRFASRSRPSSHSTRKARQPPAGERRRVLPRTSCSSQRGC
jgi:hypothetical protein